MLSFIVRLLSTFFYAGTIPFVPGTWGSLAGLVLYAAVCGNQLVLAAACVVVSALGFWSAGRMEALLGKKDASCIVIDEVAGMLLSLLLIPPEPRFVIFGFFLFRLLDTFKPYPAGRLQRLKGGTGVMIDDIIAGVYTNIILRAIILISHK